MKYFVGRSFSLSLLGTIVTDIYFGTTYAGHHHGKMESVAIPPLPSTQEKPG
jgi:hypothetical protein